MSRSARIVIPDYPYHITQRGNYRQNVFIDDGDRIKYLSWIDEYSKRYQLSILAFCLMNNHVHFITIPGKEDSLSKVFSIVHMRHSQYLNKRMGKSGHLWQGRFYSCVLDENYLIASLRYVENNPVRAGILKEAWKWKWSSAAYSAGIADGLIELRGIEDFTGMFFDNWRQFLLSEESEEDIKIIRKYTVLGRPLGTDDFIAKMSRRANKVLTVMQKGRPRKNI